jgi:hypothetical protein
MWLHQSSIEHGLGTEDGRSGSAPQILIGFVRIQEVLQLFPAEEELGICPVLVGKPDPLLLLSLIASLLKELIRKVRTVCSSLGSSDEAHSTWVLAR